MDIRGALKGQYGSGLAMLRQCVELCPEDLWGSGEHPRTYARIAFHAAYFTHLYLGQTEEVFEAWPACRDDLSVLWQIPTDVEPYELPESAQVLSRAEMMQYIDFVAGLTSPMVDRLDLDAEATGFAWYPNMNKLSHQLLNLRHLQGHVGQLSELLMMRNIDIDWV